MRVPSRLARLATSARQAHAAQQADDPNRWLKLVAQVKIPPREPRLDSRLERALDREVADAASASDAGTLDAFVAESTHVPGKVVNRLERWIARDQRIFTPDQEEPRQRRPAPPLVPSGLAIASATRARELLNDAARTRTAADTRLLAAIAQAVRSLAEQGALPAELAADNWEFVATKSSPTGRKALLFYRLTAQGRATTSLMAVHQRWGEMARPLRKVVRAVLAARTLPRLLFVYDTSDEDAARTLALLDRVDSG